MVFTLEKGKFVDYAAISAKVFTLDKTFNPELFSFIELRIFHLRI